MTNKEIFEKIAASCPPEVALSLAGLSLRKRKGGPTVSRIKNGTYISPMRDERNASFTLFQDKSGTWRYSDKGTNERSGNMINLVAKALGIRRSEAARMIDDKLGLNLWQTPGISGRASRKRRYDNIHDRPLDEETAQRIAKAVGVKGCEGIWRLHRLGILHVGDVWFSSGHQQSGFPQKNCWLLVDPETRAATARRIDGERIGRNKSMTPRGWKKQPVGLGLYDDSIHKSAILAEGEKDLAAIMLGVDDPTVLPICMPSIDTSCNDFNFPKVERAIIFAQADKAGIEAAARWAKWAARAGAEVQVRYPMNPGADWADLLSLATKQTAEGVLESRWAAHWAAGRLIEDHVDGLPDAKNRLKPPKQRGCTPNFQREARIREAQQDMSPLKRNSPSALCRALGLDPTSSNRTKIMRSLRRMEKEKRDRDNA